MQNKIPKMYVTANVSSNYTFNFIQFQVQFFRPFGFFSLYLLLSDNAVRVHDLHQSCKVILCKTIILLELVKTWVGKSLPSFLQTLHISPILDKLTELSYIAQQKLFNRNARNRQVMIFSRKSLFLGKNIYIIAIRIYGGGYLQR